MEIVLNVQNVCRMCLEERANMECIFDFVLSENDDIKFVDFIDTIASVKVGSIQFLISTVILSRICYFRY